jgi:hypothetical protein
MDLVGRLAWFVFFSTVVTYAFFLFTGSITLSNAKNLSPTVIRNHTEGNAHYLSGVVMVESECDQILISSEKAGWNIYILRFRTWIEPSLQHCKKNSTPRPFTLTVYAPPNNARFIATLDDKSFPIVVIPSRRIIDS